MVGRRFREGGEWFMKGGEWRRGEGEDKSKSTEIFRKVGGKE